MLLRSILATAALAAAFAAHAQGDPKVLRVVPHSNLAILDPHWTTAYMSRNHGYMIYDTLFGTDDKNQIKPQMVESWTVSPDNRLWTFQLRKGLAFHDGAPVTGDDVIASLARWGKRDAMGIALFSFVDRLDAPAPDTFRIFLREACGFVMEALGKPSSNVPFIMPKRIADTPATEQIKEYVGSGPFVMKTDEWKPGEKVVYTKFAKYKPRTEAPSGMAGAKVAKVDRIEWRTIPDPQTAVNALVAGEVDMVEDAKSDLLPVVAKDANLKLYGQNPLGNQYAFRFNALHKPFDNPKIRQAVFYALNQEDFLKAVHGDPKYYKVCKALFICGTPLATDKGMDGLLESNFKKSRELLAEAKYDGTPVLLLHSTDLEVLTNLAPVAKSLLERGGFKVDMQSMDWQSVVARRAKKDPPSAGGWNAMITSWVAADALNPVGTAFLNSSCDKALYGWPCDEKMEQLRDAFARESDPAKQKAIAEQVQLRYLEVPTHVHLGQWYKPIAMRKNIDGMVSAPVVIFWNIEKK